jgi:hypothetical protein|tara:strand:+ start:1472 stop:1759 length:288 start_codon:yes stop_codon:yes gene_type:complete
MIQGIIALFKAMPFLARLFEKAVDAYRIQKANARHDEKVRNIDDTIDGIVGDGMSVGRVEQLGEADGDAGLQGSTYSVTFSDGMVSGSTENDSKP